ncbi:MAG: glycosyl transferase [Acidobacteria bacterium]|nr:MAG: glycosyl transferase [Acidobacteriota bacterium]
MRSLSFVIPAFNEESRLGPTLAAIVDYIKQESLTAEILVVDDGSRDRTAELVENFARDHSMVRLVRNGKNRGKGYSVCHGVMEAAGNIIIVTDADLAVPIEQCRKLVRALDFGFDIAIGSRTLDQRLQRVKPPFYRRICSLAFRAMVRMLLALHFEDTQCGFKAFSSEAAKRTFAMQKIEGWGFDPEILLIASLLGFRIKEIPVETFHREGSKINLVRDSARMFMELLAIRRRVFAEVTNLSPVAVSTVLPVTEEVATNEAEAA